MPTLYVLSGPQIGKTFELAHGSVLGRAPTCEPAFAVALRDSSVSRDHARVERDGDAWFIVDLGSSNGVHFGGLRVQREELRDQAEFRLGELELRVKLEAKPVAKPKPVEVIESSFDEIELEEEIELELEPEVHRAPAPPPYRRPAPAPAAAPAPPPAKPRERAPLRSSGAAPSNEPVMKRRILQYNRVENRSGIFTTEISQWPPWVQGVMGIVAVAVFAGIVYGVYTMTVNLKN